MDETIPDSLSTPVPDADLADLAGLPETILTILGAAAGLLILIGVPVFLMELWKLWRTGGLTKRRLAGMATSAFCLVPAGVVEAVFIGALIALFFAAGSLAPWSLPITIGTALVCLLLVDFLYYWEHRLGHEVNLLWSLYHSVHHSGDHFDQTIGLRVSFVDFFVTPLIYLPLVIVGFHPLLVLSCFGLVLAWQQWIHTELVGRLPLLDPWLNTPSNHRVHHGRNPDYLDRNYGGILMIWDRLFGTYAPEREPVDYGLVEQLRSRNPAAVHFHGLVKFVRQIGSVPSLMRHIFGRPGDHIARTSDTSNRP